MRGQRYLMDWKSNVEKDFQRQVKKPKNYIAVVNKELT